MEQSTASSLYEQLSEANPIQKKTRVPPRSLFPLLPLPNFGYSSQEEELGSVPKSKEPKEQHILKQPNLARLFENPIYRANCRIRTGSNLQFGCIRAFYSQSVVHQSPPRAQSLSGQLEFESRFESGNLGLVCRCLENANEYYLLLHKDVNTSKCTQWFFFRVRNWSFRGRVRFHIINLIKNYSAFESGMKVSYCNEKGQYIWTRGCEEIIYLKNNIQIGKNRTYYTLSFTYNFKNQDDITYFAHSPPYSFSMLDDFLLQINNNQKYQNIVKRKTLTQSPAGNYVDQLTITNFKSKKIQKKLVYITARVHAGQTPASFACEGIISFLISNHQDAKKLREHFVFKIVPMLNPDGVINGNYRCSLSGYDLNRVWYFDNKRSSPEIYYTKKAILQQQKCFLYIDLHAHSKKKGIFMYGCQNRTSPHISRQIPYLFWKHIPYFNYYQCNFGMKLGREGTSRLTVHRILNLPYSYTMQYSFCSSVKGKNHFLISDYKQTGVQLCKTLRRYYCRNTQENEQIFKQLYNDKQLMRIGCIDDGQSSQDSDLDQPKQFFESIQHNSIPLKRNSPKKNEKIFDSTMISFGRFAQKLSARNCSPRKRDSLNFQSILKAKQQKSVNLTSRKFYPSSQMSSVDSLIKIDKDLKEDIVESNQQSEQKPIQSEKSDGRIAILRSNSRYEYQQIESLNNLFLPSITSVNYKRYAKKKSNPKDFIHVGKKFLEVNALIKQEIKSVSKRKAGWKEQILSYL